MLDLSANFVESFVDPAQPNIRFADIAGRRMFDGLPFQMDGRACLYGKEVALATGKSRADFPEIFGIKVGRAFDELHLLHAAHWSDVEGKAIARIRMNYSDGSQRELDLGYGVHVRDWQRLQSEEREAVTDADTKVIWRGPGIANFRSSQRVFKSKLMNPFPSKQVDTIDFVSTGQIGSYDVYAATVANSDPRRPLTPPVPLDRPERKFDGKLTVIVLDHLERPVEGAWVYPSLSVPGSNWVTIASPLYTTAKGTGIVKFPTDKTWCIIFNVRKEGWHSVSEQVAMNADGASESGIVVTLRLSQDSDTVAEVVPPSHQESTAPGPLGTPANSAAPAPSGEPPVRTSQSSSSVFRPSPILMISAPVGSTVRIEFSDTLAPEDWKPLTTITITQSPYAFVCGQEEGPLPTQRFYRAATISSK